MPIFAVIPVWRKMKLYLLFEEAFVRQTLVPPFLPKGFPSVLCDNRINSVVPNSNRPQRKSIISPPPNRPQNKSIKNQLIPSFCHQNFIEIRDFYIAIVRILCYNIRCILLRRYYIIYYKC